MFVEHCKFTCPSGSIAYLDGATAYLLGGATDYLGGATAYLVGLTVMIRLDSVQVKLYLNCQLELSMAKITYKINFLIKWGHIHPSPRGR